MSGYWLAWLLLSVANIAGLAGNLRLPFAARRPLDDADRLSRADEEAGS